MRFPPIKFLDSKGQFKGYDTKKILTNPAAKWLNHQVEFKQALKFILEQSYILGTEKQLGIPREFWTVHFTALVGGNLAIYYAD